MLIVSVVIPIAAPILELATPKLLVEIDSMVPFGFVFGLMRTAMEVAKTWKLFNDGATAKVLVEAVIVIVWVEALA